MCLGTSMFPDAGVIRFNYGRQVFIEYEDGKKLYVSVIRPLHRYNTRSKYHKH